MKAVVTIIDDDGRILEKDKVIEHSKEVIDVGEGSITTITTYFNFMIKRASISSAINYGRQNDNNK